MRMSVVSPAPSESERYGDRLSYIPKRREYSLISGMPRSCASRTLDCSAVHGRDGARLRCGSGAVANGRRVPMTESARADDAGGQADGAASAGHGRGWVRTSTPHGQGGGQRDSTHYQQGCDRSWHVSRLLRADRERYVLHVVCPRVCVISREARLKRPRDLTTTR